MKNIVLKIKETMELVEQWAKSATGVTLEKANAVNSSLRAALIQAEELSAMDQQGRKKANIVYGEFRLPGGRFDFEDKKPIPLVFADKKLIIECGAQVYMESQFAEWLKQTWNIQDSDIFLNRWFVDRIQDTLTFCVCFQTDLVFKDNSDIAIETPALRAHGILGFNKVYLRAPEIHDIPQQIFKFSLRGIAFPPTMRMPENMDTFYYNILACVAQGAELVDLRAFGPGNQILVEQPITALLVSKRPIAIFTQWSRHKLLPDGKYRKY